MQYLVTMDYVDPDLLSSEARPRPVLPSKPRHKPRDPKRELRWQFGGLSSSWTTRRYAR
jgi:hypothetical protein